MWQSFIILEQLYIVDQGCDFAGKPLFVGVFHLFTKNEKLRSKDRCRVCFLVIFPIMVWLRYDFLVKIYSYLKFGLLGVGKTVCIYLELV